MSALLLAEFKKVVSLRVNIVLALVGVLLVSAPTLAVFFGDLDVSRVVLRFIDDGAIVLIALGVMAMTSEFRHDLVSGLFLIEPRRDQVLAAKLLAYAVIGGGLALVMSLAHFISVQVGVAVSGDQLTLPGGTLWAAYGGFVLGGALWCSLGVAIGSVVVNQAAALGVTLIWAAMVERVVAALWDPGRYLPGSVLSALAGSSVETEPVAAMPAALILLTYVLAFGAWAWRSLHVRDVTD